MSKTRTMFQQRHYKVIAEVLDRCSNSAHADVVVGQIAEALADLFAADNPNFDREHFMAVVRGERAPNSRPPRRPREEE